MGSIEFGKIANMTVFDCDFLHDDIEKVAQANIIATIVDGEVVFKARSLKSITNKRGGSSVITKEPPLYIQRYDDFLNSANIEAKKCLYAPNLGLMRQINA